MSTNRYDSTYTGAQVDAAVSVYNRAGAIYISADSTSPASIFGGTWEQIKDVFLLAAGNVYAAGSTGGSATVSLTAAQNGAHEHSLWSYSGDDVLANAWAVRAIMSKDNSQSMGTSTSGAGEPHNNMPPYLTVYFWKRIS